MLDYLKRLNWEKIGLFAGGILLGTTGVKVLASDDAKKVYTNTTAAVLRVNDCFMTTTTKLQENAEEILAQAKQLNRERINEEFVSDEEIEENEQI